MPDLAAAVGGLRQTGFKPSDVGGGVFSGQGRRAVAPGMAAPAQSATHLPPSRQPHLTVEYVEEGQIVNADRREFQSALGGLKKTGLGGHLRDAPQQQEQQTSHSRVQEVATTAPAAAALHAGPAPQATTQSVTGAGQWQGLPQQQTGGTTQNERPSWQAAAGKLRSTGLMGGGNGSGSIAVAGRASQSYGDGSLGQDRQGQSAPPWQQGAAGLRRTGLVPGGSGHTGGDVAVGGLDMGRLNLDAAASVQQNQQQWQT